MQEHTIEELFEYLSNLRDSGVTNMYGATPYLMNEFGLNREFAQHILLLWFKSFDDFK
jgi:hypothetical protein